MSAPVQSVPGLLPNSIFRKGATIEIKPGEMGLPANIKYTSTSDPFILELEKGPEYDWIDQECIEALLNNEFQLNSAIDRMGCRLNEGLPYSSQQELISSGIIPGTIQLTNSGQLIILLKDAQTTGGYPRIGILTDESLNKAGQLKPMDKIRFSIS